jgi:hypothetical protein
VKVQKEYVGHLDSKKRITIREPEYAYYHVREYEDGHIEMYPRVLVDPGTISENTLHMLDKAMDNYKKGRVSEPIDVQGIDIE